jgi:cysteine-rich repeat protein
MPHFAIEQAVHFWKNSFGTGIAQFTNRNFVSPDTNFEPCFDNAVGDANHYCAPSDFDSPGPQNTKPELVGLSPSLSEYLIRATEGTDVAEADISSLSIFSQNIFSPVFGPWVFSVNDRTFKAANTHLIPQAISYSAGLINFFFRGQIDAQRDSDDTLILKNLGNEALDGAFQLYYDNADGTRVLLPSLKWVGRIDRDSSSDTGLRITIPDGAKKFILVFIGTLGDEKDAVIGAIVSLPRCGDGEIDVGEQCDDNNMIDEDGCTNQCLVEPFCSRPYIRILKAICGPGVTPFSILGEACGPVSTATSSNLYVWDAGHSSPSSTSTSCSDWTPVSYTDGIVFTLHTCERRDNDPRYTTWTTTGEVQVGQSVPEHRRPVAGGSLLRILHYDRIFLENLDYVSTVCPLEGPQELPISGTYSANFFPGPDTNGDGVPSQLGSVQGGSTLGRFTNSYVAEFLPPLPSPVSCPANTLEFPLHYLEGAATFESSGEQLFFASPADGVTCTDPITGNFTFQGTVIYKGGTGQFTDASGMITIRGSGHSAADFSGSGQYSFNGLVRIPK